MTLRFDLTHAKHDPAHCLTPGLFRSLKRGGRKNLKLDVTHLCGVESLRFTGLEPLGADDMRLLQGIVAMSGPAGFVLSPKPVTEMGQQLRRLLNPQFDAAEKDARVVRTTISHLLAETGISDGGYNIKAVIASLRRMASVTVLVHSGSLKAVFQLLSYVFDSDNGRLLVALNPRVTDAVVEKEHGFTRIPMAEVRALGSDPARLIHQRLCGWINPGKTRDVAMNTLCGYVWIDEANSEAKKKRYQVMRKAVVELVALGWTADEYARGKFTIGRPAVS